MLLPPAPTVCTSSAAALNGTPLMMRLCESWGLPFWMRHTSVLVPPMSNVMMFA